MSFHVRFQRFVDLLENTTIEDYFEINKNTTNNKIITFSYKKNDNSIFLSIKCIKKNNYDFYNFPYEISNIISSYCDDIINLEIEINYDYHYPFKNPRWNLLNLEHNIKSLLNLDEYYQYMINNHNLYYDYDWSPIITIEKDIIDFFRKINYFDYIFEYK